MPWDSSAPVNPKYRTAEHRERRAALVCQLKAGGVLICTATVCVMPTREITNPNGNARDGLHLGHEDDGVTYRGPQHNACNVKDGAKRARARQGRRVPTGRRWVL
jgi:hypothetical protein